MLSKDNNAVSAVIGIILMVVITVVLAATVAIFSFNFSNALPTDNNVMVQVERVNDTCIFIKNVGSNHLNNIVFDAPGTPNGQYGVTPAGVYGAFNVTCNGNEISNLVTTGTVTCTSELGSLQYFSPVPPNSNVDVIANFKDGTSHVAWTGTV